jgi:hypothetical protein
MKKKVIFLLAIVLAFSVPFLFAAKVTIEKKPIDSKIVFFGNFPNSSVALESLIKDETGFKPYNEIVPAVDFAKNNLLVITRPGLPNEFSLELNDIYESNKEIVVQYSYTTTPAEVMMLGKLLAITLPKSNLSVRVILHAQDYKNKPVISEKVFK